MARYIICFDDEIISEFTAKGDMMYVTIGMDVDGFDVTQWNEWDKLADARKHAKRCVANTEAIRAGLHKVEIHKTCGKGQGCVADYFVKG